MSKKLNGKAKAKARKMKQKASMKPISNVIGIGAFYKGMDDDGFSFSMDSMSEPKKGLTKVLHDNVVMAGKGILQEFRDGTWDVAGCKEQLAQAIESFNVKTFGSTERPLASAKVQNLKVSIDAIPELIAIMSDIYALEQVGVIKSDEYNGMMYMKSNFKMAA